MNNPFLMKSNECFQYVKAENPNMSTNIGAILQIATPEEKSISRAFSSTESNLIALRLKCWINMIPPKNRANGIRLLFINWLTVTRLQISRDFLCG
jgi:hypothetical protein